MKLIKIKDAEQLMDIQNISEKLNQIGFSLKIRLDEKKLFHDTNDQLDIMDTVLEFFIEWCEEFNEQISEIELGDSIHISKSEKNMVKKMMIFYESEVNGVDKNFLENQSDSFKEVLNALEIEMEQFMF
jgi:hypothetical protein